MRRGAAGATGAGAKVVLRLAPDSSKDVRDDGDTDRIDEIGRDVTEAAEHLAE